eukprot:Blabericola_migrator_1__1560@NODE_1412_length_4603_cov_85_831349_g939_i0_p3_GENE_NODE_1412_length_4603_cov_85_831349_g939_i0NODE_1412_length_4603_cov_85_831349_g939_i0_p3_ORF_typecomplete_len234_score29_70SIN1/PF05422_12/0_09_NODE_1412_length_4603_cov_85_831349_g939_i0149850
MAASFAPSRVYLIENGEKQMLEQHNFEGAAYRRGIEIQLGRIPNSGFREAVRRRITGDTNKEKFASLRSLLDRERLTIGDRIKWPDILVEKVQNYVPLNPQKAQKRKDREAAADKEHSYSKSKRAKVSHHDDVFSDDSADSVLSDSDSNGDFAVLHRLRGNTRRRRERYNNQQQAQQQHLDMMMMRQPMLEFFDNPYLRDAHTFKHTRKEPAIYSYDMYGFPPDGLRFYRRTW